MDIKVNSVVGSNEQSLPNFPDGVDIGSNSSISVHGHINVVGVTTLQSIFVESDASTANLYSDAYVGDGSQLTGIVTTTTPSKVIGLKYIFADPPLRA